LKNENTSLVLLPEPSSPLLWQLFGDQMSNLRRLRAERKGQGASLYFAILGGQSFVLTQVLAPRFSDEDLNVSLRIRSITK
jgi:hypothetical protein